MHCLGTGGVSFALILLVPGTGSAWYTEGAQGCPWVNLYSEAKARKREVGDRLPEKQVQVRGDGVVVEECGGCNISLEEDI